MSARAQPATTRPRTTRSRSRRMPPLSSVRTVPQGLAGVDLTDLDAFADGFPHDLFARHRREAPVYWHEPTEHTPDGEGFWSVATYAESLEVIRDPVTYSSER